MSFQYLSNTPLEEAVSGYCAAIKALNILRKTEIVPAGESCGRITSRAVYAKICAPHYNACAMDGIALSADKTFGASETTPALLSEADFERVDTGDPLPDGCDCVVMIEDVVEDRDGQIKLLSASVPWQHVRQIGEDVCAGDMILTSRTEISPAAAGAMLAGGVLKVEVFKRPLVGIIPTGDEIVVPTDNPQKGDIIEFNSTIFSAMLAKWGALSRVYGIVPDEQEKMLGALKTALAECDAVIINAGSSAGREDYSKKTIERVGEVLFHGVAIKPGKPAILGICSKKPVIGVPGYPVSGMIVLERIVKPVMDLLLEAPEEVQEHMRGAVISRKLMSSLKYREFVRTRLGLVEGRLVAVPLNRGAGVISSFVKADGIIDIPQNVEGYEAGDTVSVLLKKPIRQIENQLVITGSHDQLIDEAADLMRLADCRELVASSHVGSMGAIMAIKRREAHLGGIHLLDGESGEYNASYLRKYFGRDDVVLLEGVARVQGLMTARGNPKNLRLIGDIAQNKVRYVNRQNGSGTRILFDYLLKSDGIDCESICGYTREEFTHTAVAAQIASGTADAGLGVFAAAKMYGLEFIPLFDEQYDFLVLKSALALPCVQSFIDTIKSVDFRKRLLALGGYGIGKIGEIKEWN
ncbi:MAG: molybdopterin biosynthesis protein [Oscillospiraceae bacterium]